MAADAFVLPAFGIVNGLGLAMARTGFTAAILGFGYFAVLLLPVRRTVSAPSRRWPIYTRRP